MPNYYDFWGETPYSAGQREKRRWKPSGVAGDVSARGRALMASQGRSMAPERGSGMSEFDAGLVGTRGNIATTEDMGADRGLGSGMLGAGEDFRKREMALAELQRRRKFAEVAQKRQEQQDALKKLLGTGLSIASLPVGGIGGMAMGLGGQMLGSGMNFDPRSYLGQSGSDARPARDWEAELARKAGY